MNKLKVVTFIVMMAIASTSIAYALEDGGRSDGGRSIESIEGRVEEIDWVGSAFTIRYLEGAQFVNMEIKVSSETKWEKSDYRDASLADLDESDLVEVDYYIDSSGDNRAVRVKIIVS